jgi:phage-related protein
MKALKWVGTSLQDLTAFPKEARREAGYEIHRVQSGLEPVNWKPMPEVGAGVCEIRIRDESGIYRLFYVANKANFVYVLHAFEKKTQRTLKSDIDLGKKRFKSI